MPMPSAGSNCLQLPVLGETSTFLVPPGLKNPFLQSKYNSCCPAGQKINYLVCVASDVLNCWFVSCQSSVSSFALQKTNPYILDTVGVHWCTDRLISTGVWQQGVLLKWEIIIRSVKDVTWLGGLLQLHGPVTPPELTGPSFTLVVLVGGNE